MTDSGTLPRDKPAGLGGRSPVADPPVAAPAGVAMSGQDVLLATKLHVPRPQPGFVPRRRLVQALDEGLARGRALVCAPAGFGKTSLLAGWARGGGLPLARLRARGQLAELRAADLRCSGEEAAALLGEAAGPGLPGTAVAALTARTEGWAAGLQLAGLSLRGHADAAGFAAAFSGSHRFVLDYLADEVLDGQPAQVRAFLLETSVLERLSGQLFDPVTAPAGPHPML